MIKHKRGNFLHTTTEKNVMEKFRRGDHELKEKFAISKKQGRKLIGKNY